MKKQPKKIHSREWQELVNRLARNMIPAIPEPQVTKIVRRDNVVVYCLTQNCKSVMETPNIELKIKEYDHNNKNRNLYCEPCLTKEHNHLLWVRSQKLNPVDEARRARVKYQKTEKYKAYQKKYQSELKIKKNVQNQNPN